MVGRIVNWPTDFVEANAILAAGVDAESNSGAFEVDEILAGMLPGELLALARASELLGPSLLADAPSTRSRGHGQAMSVNRVVVAIRAIHERRTSPIADIPADHAYCVEDRQTWPCATIAALEAVIDEIAAESDAEGF